jgi:hypothetical protein
MHRWLRGFMAYWWDILGRTLRLLLGLYKRADLLGGFLTWLGLGVGTWLQLIPLRAWLIFGGLLVLYAFMAAIFEKFREVEDEKIALEEKLDTAARYRAFRTLLGEAIHEGELVRQSSLLKPLQEWVDRTEAFLEDALDKPVALRFLDNTGFTREDLEGNVVEETLPDLHHEKYVRELRMRRLHELALRVKPEDIDPSFNPQDYENYFRTEVAGPL